MDPRCVFVAVRDSATLVEALCVQDNRVVNRDNTVSWEGLTLQLPQSPLRHHWVKARVRIHGYPNGALAVFHGPRCIARYTAEGVEIVNAPTARSVTPAHATTLSARRPGGRRGNQTRAILGPICANREVYSVAAAAPYLAASPANRR